MTRLKLLFNISNEERKPWTVVNNNVRQLRLSTGWGNSEKVMRAYTKVENYLASSILTNS